MLGENIFKSIIKRSLILLAVVMLAILIIADEPKPYIYGYLFGMIINILNFRLMSLSIKKALTLKEGSAQKYAVSNYLVRYIIYGIVLYIAAVADYLDLLAVVLGFFTVKLIIISDTFFDQFRGRKAYKDND